MLSPLQTKLSWNSCTAYLSSKVKSGWIRSWNSEATWDVSQSPGASLAHEVTLVNVIYSHLCFIMRHTHVGSALLLCWFMIMNFHKKIMEVVRWHRDSTATLTSENKNNTTALLLICEVHACIWLVCDSSYNPNSKKVRNLLNIHCLMDSEWMIYETFTINIWLQLPLCG